jgi:hypothetical protein
MSDVCGQTPEVKAYQGYGGITAGQWKDGIDEFYKDFRNRTLDVRLAIRWVNEQLHGTPTEPPTASGVSKLSGLLLLTVNE